MGWNQSVGLLFGSTTGNTARVAERITELWQGSQSVVPLDIASVDFAALADYDCLIVGAPTWDFGELQQDWNDAWDAFCQLDFSGVQVALFGVGDQLGYPEWFQDSMGLIGHQIRQCGGTLVAPWPTEGYNFEASLALSDDGVHFIGLALDEDSQSWATDERLETWLKSVAQIFNERRCASLV